ncbi:MAG: polysaccharide deacetylase family protein [Phycisphaerae bacterium]|nr:polysaccharide deacetylase family protein [Phycisphaerae bacterium]
MALIFTGGDYGEGTMHILDTLGARGIRASFFVTGDYIAKPEYHVHLRRMVAEGHYLGPHSDKHLLYCAWEDRSRTLVTEAEFKQDLRANIDALQRFGAMAGDGPIYFIPPYEWFNADQVRWATDMGVVLFNFTPGSGSNRDYMPESHARFVDSQTILRDILACERKDPHGFNGFLLLLHLGAARQDKMFLLLDPLLDELIARGYAFARVDELLRLPAAGSQPHERPTGCASRLGLH